MRAEAEHPIVDLDLELMALDDRHVDDLGGRDHDRTSPVQHLVEAIESDLHTLIEQNDLGPHAATEAVSGVARVASI